VTTTETVNFISYVCDKKYFVQTNKQTKSSVFMGREPHISTILQQLETSS